MDISEETTTAAIPDVQPAYSLPCGTPVFKVDDDIFFNLHLKQRKDKGWYDKHYKDSNVAQWARKNKGKEFYIKHGEKEMYRKIKAN